MANLKMVHELNRDSLASRMAIAKQANRLSYLEDELQAMRF